jgi:hypothetical protein
MMPVRHGLEIIKTHRGRNEKDGKQKAKKDDTTIIVSNKEDFKTKSTEREKYFLMIKQ